MNNQFSSDEIESVYLKIAKDCQIMSSINMDGYIDRAIHRLCLEIVCLRELRDVRLPRYRRRLAKAEPGSQEYLDLEKAIKKTKAAIKEQRKVVFGGKGDMIDHDKKASNDLAVYLKRIGLSWILVDWIFENPHKAKDKIHKDTRGINHVAKYMPNFSGEIHKDVYSEIMLQLTEEWRRGWRGEHGAHSILNYIDRVFRGVRADFFERQEDDRKYRQFDLTQPGSGGEEAKIMAGPGGETPGERSGDSVRTGFWGIREGLDKETGKREQPDEEERRARAAFRTNHPDFISETWGRSAGTSEGHQDHWLDDLKTRGSSGRDWKPCFFGGGPAPAVGDEKELNSWIESTYWMDPYQVYERTELYSRAFEYSKYDPKKSPKENLNEARRAGTLRFTGILKQNFGEDWEAKEIAGMWARGRYRKQDKDDFIKHLESFGLRYIGHKIVSKEIIAHSVKGIIKRQKKLAKERFRELGYIPDPIVHKFPDPSIDLIEDKIKKEDLPIRTEEIVFGPGDGYFKGKAHYRPWEPFTRTKDPSPKESIESFLRRGGTIHVKAPADIKAQRFPQIKTGIYAKHFDLINEIRKLQEKHATRHKICVKCGRREQVNKTRLINGLRYCLECKKNIFSYYDSFSPSQRHII